MGTFYVNRSGVTLKVYDRHQSNATVIGYVKPNHVYAITEAFGGNGTAGVEDYKVDFFPGNGTVKSGWIFFGDEYGSRTPLKNCALFQTNIYPELPRKVYGVFSTKRKITTYYTDGNLKGALPSNYYIASATCTSGQKNPSLMFIDHSGAAEPMPNECFVDLELKKSALVTDLPIAVKLA